MDIFVFRTNIGTKKLVEALKPVFSKQRAISRWSVDIEDIDNVMRVVTKARLPEMDIIKMVRNLGFECEALEN